jgi:hypothetical protein
MGFVVSGTMASKPSGSLVKEICCLSIYLCSAASAASAGRWSLIMRAALAQIETDAVPKAGNGSASRNRTHSLFTQAGGVGSVGDLRDRAFISNLEGVITLAAEICQPLSSSC